MAKVYKIWIELEEVDEDNDHYETIPLDFAQEEEFDTLEDALAYANKLHNAL